MHLPARFRSELTQGCGGYASPCSGPSARTPTAFGQTGVSLGPTDAKMKRRRHTVET
jgi:hypothetical protein